MNGGVRPEAASTVVRAITPADADALVRFHEALSPDSQRLRFFGIHPHLTATEVRRFTTVDHRDREALVLVEGSEILGVGRYDRLGETASAEVAFVTRDDRQGNGIATRLFHALTALARAAGITQFLAETLPENRRMLGVFGATGLVTSQRFARGVVEVTMSLPDVDAPGVHILHP